MPKQTHLTIRLAAAAAAEIQAEADEAGMSISAWIRQAVLQRAQLDLLAAELKAETQEQVAALDTKLTAMAADLKAVQQALENQVNRGYFIRVTQHLSKQLAAIMSHHKIAMPKED